MGEKIGIPATLQRYAAMIDEIEDYRDQGPDGDGYWVHLKPGFICTLHGVHSVHEDNITQCATVFRDGFVDRCGCDECLRMLAERQEKSSEDSQKMARVGSRPGR